MSNTCLKKSYSRANGMTLVETVVYVAIMVIVLVGVVGVILFTTNSFKELRATRDLKSSAQIAMERMTREIREAKAITLASSIFDTSPGRIALVTSTGMVDFYLEDGTVKVDENGTYVGDMTLPNVTVTGLTFYRVDGLVSDAIRIALTLERSGDSGSQATFYNAAVVRELYTNQ